MDIAVEHDMNIGLGLAWDAFIHVEASQNLQRIILKKDNYLPLTLHVNVMYTTRFRV